MAEVTNHDECECPVCQEDYVDPKLLRCGHIICRQCVLTWLETGDRQNGCPLCRAAILHSDKTLSSVPDLSTLIDSLPTDVAVISMVECKQLLKGDHVCCVCDDNTTASTVCMDCNIKLCQSCSKSHRKFPAFRVHVLEELGTLTPERLAGLRKSSCDVHKERPAELYCPTHQSLVCLVCSSSTHRSCHDVTVLSDFANSERQTLKSQCESLRKMKTSLEEQMIQLEERLHNVQAVSNVKKKEVKDVCDRMKQLVDRQCQDLLARVEEDAEMIVSKINTEKSALKDHHSSVVAHVFVADRLLTTAADGSLVQAMPNLKVSMLTLQSQDTSLSPIEDHEVSFDSEMLKSLENTMTLFEKTIVTGAKAKKCMVLYDYDPQSCEELELKTGSIVEFHKEMNEWWWQGTACGKAGIFPSNYVTMLENEDEDEDDDEDEDENEDGDEDEDEDLDENEGKEDSEDESNQLIPEDTLEDIKERLDELLDMPELDVCQIEECMKKLAELFSEHQEHRTALADAVYYHGYPILLAKLLKKLSTMAFNDEVWSLVKITYNSILWDYSDEGDKLAKGLADAGLVSTLTSNLSCKKYIKSLDDTNVYDLLEASINTLHNIARWSEVKYYFKKCKTHEAMKPFLTLDDTKYRSLKVSATVTSVYIAMSERILKRDADKDVINNIVSWLEYAMESDNDTFECFAPFEFAQALVKLADNDSNKLKIVEAGGLSPLLNLLQQDDVKGQAMGAKCLWTICFNLKARQKIIEFPEIIESLEMLTESEFPDVRVNAAFALWAIKDDGCF